jgi:hypothetical protein
MTKYEPNSFVFPREKLKFPEDKVRSAPSDCKGEPLNAGVLAMSVLDNFFSQEQKDIIALNNCKSQILPGKLQEKVSIAALSKGMLILKSKSSVWASEALAKKTDIVAACNRILGKMAVKSLKFG